VKSEKETRKEVIDKRLLQAGWNVSDRTQVIEEPRGHPLKGKSRENAPLHTKKHLVFFAWLQRFAPVQPRFRLPFRTRYFSLVGSRSANADPHQSPIGIKAGVL